MFKTNTDLPADHVALKYKELWQVEQAFRDIKSILETSLLFHQRSENILGHVFCTFLALVLRKELDRRLLKASRGFEWPDIKQDLKAQPTTIFDSTLHIPPGVHSMPIRLAQAGLIPQYSRDN